jgi:membrane protease YdiL (CAAX protease family)
MSELRGALRATRLLLRLRLTRLINQVAAGLLSRKTASGARRATAGKARRGWVLGIVVAALMGAGMLQWSVGALANMAQHGAMAEALPAAGGSTLEAMPASPVSVRSAGFALTLLLFAVLLFGLGTKELWQPEWDLEWLITLPMPLRAVLGIRVLERTLVNPTGLLMIWPFLSAVAWEGGYRTGAPFLGLAFTLPLLALIATVRTVIDTGLRVTLSTGKLRNLQALLSIAGMLLFYLALSAGLSRSPFVLDWADLWPDAGRWLPTGLPIAALAHGDVAANLGLLFLEVGALTAAGLAFVAWQLRQGVVAFGVRSGVARGTTAASEPERRRRFLTPIQARELRLLGRDRNFLVQTLIVPVVVFGAQIFLNRDASAFGSSFANTGAVAFGVATYTLFFSAFQGLNTEGGALWILYSVPEPLDRLLRQKAIFWGLIVLVYPISILAVGFAIADSLSTEAIAVAAVVLVGVPIYTLIAASLGVLATDPLAQEARHRMRIRFGYVYMILASLYTYAIYADDLWQCLVIMVLTALVGLALWQKARDRLPYLLDPVALPPARVSLADGLIAAQAFMVLQALVQLVFARAAGVGEGTVLFIAFWTAGMLVYGLMRFTFWRTGALGVPVTVGRGSLRALAGGIAAGGVAGAFGVLYLTLGPYLGAPAELFRHEVPSLSTLPWIFIIAVLAAPIFEEFIFRGLVFGGLRRSLRRWPAILASAAIFAIIHPPLSVLPVFVLGITAALAYERTGLLLAPMAAHAVFNGLLLGVQWLT